MVGDVDTLETCLEQGGLEPEDLGWALNLTVRRGRLDAVLPVIAAIEKCAYFSEENGKGLLRRIWSVVIESAIKADQTAAFEMLVAHPIMAETACPIELFAYHAGKQGNITVMQRIYGLSCSEVTRKQVLDRMLQAATSTCDVPAVLAVLSMGAQVDGASLSGHRWAVRHPDHAKVVRIIVERWIQQERDKPDCATRTKLEIGKNQALTIALHAAIRFCDTATQYFPTVEYLLDIGVNPVLNDTHALLIALDVAQIQMLDTVIQHAKCPSDVLNEGLCRAAALQKSVAVERLIQAGATNVDEALRRAIDHPRDYETAKVCLRHGADPDLDKSLLFRALQTENVDLVRILLDFKADPLMPISEDGPETLFDRAISAAPFNDRSCAIADMMARAVRAQLVSATPAEDDVQANTAQQAKITRRPR